jgi:hypothetical protein
MARARGLTLESSETDLVIDFGTFALILYYARQIDRVAAKKMFDAISSEYRYRMNYDLPLDGLTIDDEEAHFNRNDIKDVVAFIEKELIPPLSIEQQPLLEKYNGKENFHKLFYTDMDFLAGIGIEKNEFYYDSPNSLIHYLNKIKHMLQCALTIDEPYVVYVH